MSASLVVNGEVERPVELSFADLAAIDGAWRIADVSTLDPKRQGTAIRLGGLLELVRPKANVRYLTLHASRDDFHASIPLDAVRERAVLIYEFKGAPLPFSAGGPVRFFIPDFAACHTAEVDECANVKFVDRIELASDKGFDNRPHDEKQHAELHAREGQAEA